MNRAIPIMAGIAVAAGAAQAQEQQQEQEQETPTEAFDQSVKTEEDREERTDSETARQREHGTQPELREPYDIEAEQNPTPIEDQYDRRADAPGTATDERDAADVPGVQQAPTGVAPASTAALAGKTIVTAQGKEVGTVEQVGFSRQHDERVATVNVGGFLGAGDKIIAIPISKLGLGEDDSVTTSMDRTALERAQPFDPSQLVTAE